MIRNGDADLLGLFRVYIEDKDLSVLFESKNESEKTLMLTDLLCDFYIDMDICNTHRDQDHKYTELAMTLRACL